MDQFDCVFTTGTTSVSSQAMGGGSDTVTCTLDNVPAALFTDNGMDCNVCTVHVLCDYRNVLCYQIFIKYSLLS